MAGEYPPWRRPPSYAPLAVGRDHLAYGKPLETMGQQSYGTKARIIRAMFAGLHTANHWKQWDAKLLWGLNRRSPLEDGENRRQAATRRRHASPAAGYFASDFAKKGS